MININENIIGKQLSNWVIISCEIANDYYFRITLKNNITNQLKTTAKHLCYINYKEQCPIICIRNKEYIRKLLDNDVNACIIHKSINHIISLDIYDDDDIIEQICFGLINKNKINMLDKNLLDYMLLETDNC